MPRKGVAQVGRRSKNTTRLTAKDKKNGVELVECITCRGKGTYHFRECGLCKGTGVCKVKE